MLHRCSISFLSCFCEMSISQNFKRPLSRHMFSRFSPTDAKNHRKYNFTPLRSKSDGCFIIIARLLVALGTFRVTLELVLSWTTTTGMLHHCQWITERQTNVDDATSLCVSSLSLSLSLSLCLSVSLSRSFRTVKFPNESFVRATNLPFGTCWTSEEAPRARVSWMERE